MILYLIKSTNEVRLETMDDVETFHKKVQKEAEEMKCTLSSFSWVEKENKKLEETYYQVKYAFVFNKLADPEVPLNKIEYKMREYQEEQENDVF